jgi:urease accessory protein UreE
MVTCKSPVAVMRAAHALGVELFDEHSHAFSRKDFTLPQLFACLVLREHQKKSYRGTEALLRDCADLRDAVGLTRAPDHNTICRAFTHLVKPAKMNRALDLQVAAAKAGGLNVKGDSVKPATLDSTCFESRHVSRHFERRRRQTAEQDRKLGRRRRRRRRHPRLKKSA